uniref:Uncharacterized protein n=1 Tax=Cannabis sativa TaxID=3483 RepID=A0A803NNM0_CANSA
MYSATLRPLTSSSIRFISVFRPLYLIFTTMEESNNTIEGMNRGIMQELGLNMATSNINYLGLPLFRSKLKDADFNFILESLVLKLHGWKLKSLSKAGRATLIKSVGLVVPIYTMQITKLSKKLA